MIAGPLRRRRTTSIALLLLLTGVAGCGDGDSGEEGRTALEDVIAQVEGLEGQQRERKLLKLAQDEGGELVFYTSLANDSESAVADAFEDEYDIEVSVYRASSETLAQRVSQETDADFRGTDVLETNGIELALLDREGIFVPYRPSSYDGLARGSKENWTVTRFNKFVVTWNTNLVPKDEQPRSLEELAEPRWKGKVAIEASDSDWYATLLTYFREQGMSEEEVDRLFERLAENARVVSGHSLMAQLLGAGEFSVAASNYEYLSIASIEDGAPVRYKPLIEPILSRPQGIALLETASHPAAALLFVEWLTTDGQDVLAEYDILPARKDFIRDPEAEQILIDVDDYVKRADEFEEDYEQLTRLGEKVEDEG